MNQTGLILRIANPGRSGLVGAYAAYVDRVSKDRADPSQPRRIPVAARVGEDSFVACAPGAYTITAYPPSGGVLSRDVEVDAGQQVEVDLGELATDAPWLDWQASSGSARARVRKSTRSFFRILSLAGAIAAAITLFAIVALGVSTFTGPREKSALRETIYPETMAYARRAEEERWAPPTQEMWRAYTPLSDPATSPTWSQEGANIVIGDLHEKGLPGQTISEGEIVETPHAQSGDSNASAMGSGAAGAPGSPLLATMLLGFFALFIFNATGGVRRMLGLPERGAIPRPEFKAELKEELEYTRVSLGAYAARAQARFEDLVKPSPLDRLDRERMLVCAAPANRRIWDILTAGAERPRVLFDSPEFGYVTIASEAKDKSRRLFEIDDNSLGKVRQGRERCVFFCISAPQNGQSALSVLPAPWLSAKGKAPLEALAASDAFGQPCLTVLARDERYATLLGYLAAGDLPMARVLIGQEFDPQKDETANPYAAAAIGYALMAGASPSDDIAPWRTWIARAQARFERFADLAILEAWCTLLAENGPSHIERARRLFLSAYDWGLPAYAEGLRRLRNGLSLFAGRPGTAKYDQAIGAQMQAVERLVRRSQPGKAFATVNLG